MHEASQLSVEAENNLDEAGELSRHLLSAWLSINHDHHLAKHISNALQIPFHKSLPKFSHTRSCFNDFQFQVNNKGWVHTLQEVANFDSSIVQSIHQKEFLQVSKWWKKLGLNKELKLVRDEPLLWYMWPMACLTDPRFSEQRIELTKPLSLVYIIDDIFDIYGSLDELTLFTDVVNRHWNMSRQRGKNRRKKKIHKYNYFFCKITNRDYRWELKAAEQQPQPLRICFNALYGITNELAHKVYVEHGWNPLSSLHKLWVRLCNAFLAEAQWFASGHMPRSEEHLKNGIITSGAQVVLGHTFLLNHGINEETVAIMDDISAIVSSVGSILRLSDDLEGSMEHDRDGHDGSYLKCYMKQNRGTSSEETRKHVADMISDSWKHLNQECLAQFPFPSNFKKVCLNTARMVPLMYNSDGNYCFSNVEKQMRSLL